MTMQRYEYTVIPAPGRGEKVRGARTGAERFSYTLLTEMNRMAAQGWEYVRAETLPCEERSGLTSRTTVYHNVLVFRREIAPTARPLDAADARLEARPHAAPAAAPRPVAATSARPETARPASPSHDASKTAAAPALAAAQHLPPADPPTDWPDGPEDDDLAAADAHAARIDNYDEPGFDPELRPETPADPPPFVQRPPLAAARDMRADAPSTPDPRPAFVADTGAPQRAAHRLGPADR